MYTSIKIQSKQLKEKITIKIFKIVCYKGKNGYLTRKLKRNSTCCKTRMYDKSVLSV